MKTLMLRVCYWGMAVSAILIAPGANKQANADVPNPVADVLKPLQVLPDVDADVDEDVPAPLAVGAASGTNAPVKPPVMVQELTPPPSLNLSPAMGEVVRLVQAGVSPDVLLAYVTNSGAVFNINSETIVYLNDLGVTNSVITALIQHDASPETAARRASANAVQPLPPGVATTAPVTNVYPPPANRNFPVAGQTSYPGDFAIATDTNAPTEQPPAIEAAGPAQENVSVNNFYSSLTPYGSWMDVDGYGLCWRPTVAVSNPYWRPYCDSGRWLWSDSGWYWYSDYSWGWAPFHYGRWCSYPRVGWVWVPGSVWGPSWVTWRYSGSYCGWAPLPPGCGWRGGGLTWYGHGVSVGFDFGLPWTSFAYVPIGHFCDWHVSRHCVPHHGIHAVHASAVTVNRVAVRNNTVVNNGIEPNTIARASRTKIPTMHVKEAALPVNRTVKPERLENNGNSLAVVRPQLPKNPPVAEPLAARGNASRGKPVNAGNVGVAAGLANPGTVTPPNSVVNTRGVGAAANLAPPNSGARDQGPARRGENIIMTGPNSRVRTETANAPASTSAQPAARANPQTATPNPQQRQSSPPTSTARNDAPAVRNPAPAPVVRNQAPATRNLAPPQTQPTARPAPPVQAGPQARNNVMIRSYAEPRSMPNPGAAAAPQSRLQNPSAMPSVRPQVVAPRAEMSRPSAAPSAPAVRSAPSAPSVSRSVPNSGGGGGGGNRSSGGGGGRGRGGD